MPTGIRAILPLYDWSIEPDSLLHEQTDKKVNKHDLVRNKLSDWILNSMA